MDLLCNQYLINEMENHVRQCFPEEACGLLGGVNNVVGVALPITNVLHSSTRFQMEPHEQLKAFTLLEEKGLDLVGFYHSHPTGPSTPSETDINEFYYPGCLSIIWSFDGQHWLPRAFDIKGREYCELHIVIIPET